MNLINFIMNNWDSMLIIVGMLVIIILGIKRGETTILRQILFSLVTKAEQEFGSNVGVLKFAAVADMIYQRIPSVLKIFYTSKDIEKMIEDVLKEAKEKWEKNAQLQEYIDKPATIVAGIKETVNNLADSAVKVAIENGTQKAVDTVNEAADKIVGDFVNKTADELFTNEDDIK